MAKAKKGKRSGKSRQEKPAGTPAALQESIATFDRGDFRAARELLAAQVDDPELSEGQRDQARRLLEATGAENTALMVGAACAGLLVLLFLIIQMTQP